MRSMPSTATARLVPRRPTQSFQLMVTSPTVVVTSGPSCQNAPVVWSQTLFSTGDMAPWLPEAKSPVGWPSPSIESGDVTNSMPRRTWSPTWRLGDSSMPVLPVRPQRPDASCAYSKRVSTVPDTSTGAAETMGAASASTRAEVKRTAAFFMRIPLVGCCDDAATLYRPTMAASSAAACACRGKRGMAEYPCCLAQHLALPAGCDVCSVV